MSDWASYYVLKPAGLNLRRTEEADAIGEEIDGGPHARRQWAALTEIRKNDVERHLGMKRQELRHRGRTWSMPNGMLLLTVRCPRGEAPAAASRSASSISLSSRTARS